MTTDHTSPAAPRMCLRSPSTDQRTAPTRRAASSSRWSLRRRPAGRARAERAGHPAGRDFLDAVDAHPTAFLLGGLLQAAAAFLLIPSAVGIAALVPDRGRSWATAGIVLTGIGAAATVPGWS